MYAYIMLSVNKNSECAVLTAVDAELAYVPVTDIHTVSVSSFPVEWFQLHRNAERKRVFEQIC